MTDPNNAKIYEGRVGIIKYYSKNIFIQILVILLPLLILKITGNAYISAVIWVIFVFLVNKKYVLDESLKRVKYGKQAFSAAVGSVIVEIAKTYLFILISCLIFFSVIMGILK